MGFLGIELNQVVSLNCLPLLTQEGIQFRYQILTDR